MKNNETTPIDYSRKWYAMSAVAMGIFMGTIDLSIVNIAMPTLVRVTNLENGQFVIVRVNDRGPHDRYVRKGRVIDLTKAAFRRISNSKKGLIDVRVEKVWGR